MGHVKDKHEKWAIALLEKIITESNRDGDAFSGEAIKYVKKARAILKKRQEYKKKRNKR